MTLALSTERAIAFWDAVLKLGPDDCWPWLLARNTISGVGHFAIKHKTFGAPRIAFELALGAPPKNYACHTCDHPWCCNPRHLFDGTAKDNNDDCTRKGRKRYVRGAANHNAKLTAAKVQEIRDLLAGGMSQRAVARRFGVSHATVWEIRHGKIWHCQDHR